MTLTPGAPSAAPVISVQNLSFRYGDEPLLDNVAFTVMPGDFIAVIGSNGAGKSTLLKLLLGELPPSGNILLFGRDVSDFKDWPKIGFVPQANPNAGFPTTAEEVVCASLYSRIGPFRPPAGKHREKARGALALVGMDGYAKRMISELSGGQLQRVMIARALAADCEMMLLDEPVSGIDSEAAAKLYELLKTLNLNGMTILMVTHDMPRVSEYAGRALCLEGGTIVELDRNQLKFELSHKHKHP